MRKLVITAASIAALVVPTAAMAAPLKPGAEVHNENANANAGWGQDRSFYASQKYFEGNMDIKQSFPTELGTVGEQHATWVATYTEPHGPTK